MSTRRLSGTHETRYQSIDLSKPYFDVIYVNNEQIRLKLTQKHLILQKELILNNCNLNINQLIANQCIDTNNINNSLPVYSTDIFNNDAFDYQHYAFASSIINYENNEKTRVVKLKRHPVHGLGLCVKGGKEHGLPLLISNMFPNQPADLSGELKIGDAILKVNDIDITQLTHDEAVHILKSVNSTLTSLNFAKASNKINENTNYDVVLTVKNYSSILEKFRQQTPNGSSTNNRSRKNSKTTDIPSIQQNTITNSNEECLKDTKVSSYKNWIDLISIPLELAHVTQYIAGTDKLREKAFEVYSRHNISSGVMECETNQKKTYLIERLNQHIRSCNQLYTFNLNQALMPSNQIAFICWGHERVHSTQNWSYWNRILIALKGVDCYLFDNCDVPQTLNDWNRCTKIYRIYESLFKIIRDHECLDERKNCFVLHNCNGTAHYMNVDCEEILVQLEKHWQRALYASIYSIGSKSFNCTYESQTCVLFIDIHKGFILMNSETNETLWSYQFAQLKTSTDDNKSKVQFYFQDPLSKRIEVKALDCNDLYCLLYVIHSFLTAKLTSVHINDIK